MLAARQGRDRKRKLRRDWERAKLGVMREAVEAKFRQHEELRVMRVADDMQDHRDEDHIDEQGAHAHHEPR